MVYGKRIWGDECKLDRDFYCSHDPEECPDCPEAHRKEEKEENG